MGVASGATQMGRCDVDRQDRAACIGRHFERARQWGVVEDAERRHRAEKDDDAGYRTVARHAPDLSEHSVYDIGSE